MRHQAISSSGVGSAVDEKVSIFAQELRCEDQRGGRGTSVSSRLGGVVERLSHEMGRPLSVNWIVNLNPDGVLSTVEQKASGTVSGRCCSKTGGFVVAPDRQLSLFLSGRSGFPEVEDAVGIAQVGLIERNYSQLLQRL